VSEEAFTRHRKLIGTLARLRSAAMREEAHRTQDESSPAKISPSGDYAQGRNLLVVWRVTTSCNLGCGFCDYNINADIPRPHTYDGDVTRFGRVLTEYGRATEQSVRISLLGGEPFLWRPIHAVSRALAPAGLSLSATTNGTALGARKVIETITSCFDVLHVSVDGLGAAHDRSRHRPGLYAKILRSISRITEASDRPRVGVNLLLTGESIADFETLCRQFGNAGVTFLSFNPLRAEDGEPEADRKLSVEHLPLLDHIESSRVVLAARTGVTVLGSARYFERVRRYVRGELIRVALDDCQPGRSRLLIDEHGRLRPCTHVDGTKEAIRVSDIRSVADLWRLRMQFSCGVNDARPAVCDDCMEPFVFGKFRLPS
jgi:MoaA/NifB/PqqE/SkfB family radical SAM enzyme